MEQFKVSIIIPMWNVETYICDALKSIKKQTLTDYEIICVDDGSIDNTVEVCEAYLKDNFTNYKLIKIEHSGVSIARNTALNVVRGKYVFFLDSDDFIIKTTGLQSLYDVAETSGCDVVISKYFNVSNDRFSKTRYCGLVNSIDYINSVYINVTCYNPSLYFCRFDTIKNIRFVEHIYMEDMVYFTDVLLNSETLYVSDILIIGKRVREGAITNSYGKYEFYNSIALDLMLQRLKPIVSEKIFSSYILESLTFLDGSRRFVTSEEYISKYDEYYNNFKSKYLTYLK